MSTYGFVYILTNDYMPGVYKVGCTERSPRLRAIELSKHTGVPAPFSVLCYAEFEDFQRVEKDLHHYLRNQRISDSREFFDGAIDWAVGWLFWHRDRIAFVEPWGSGPCSTLLSNGPAELSEVYDDLTQLPDPWAEKQPTKEGSKEIALRVITGAAESSSVGASDA